MHLKGQAFLALWNDFDSARDAEYNCWHTFEHVPERVGIDGVLSSRRYVALDRTDWRYFTLYELSNLEALAGASYLNVVEQPSEWTLTMRPSFRNFCRRPCATVWSDGIGHGGSIATLRVRMSSPSIALGEDAWRRALQPLIASAVTVAVHVGRVDTEAKFPLPNAAGAPEASEGESCVVLVEGTDRDHVHLAAEATLEALHGLGCVCDATAWEAYDLAFSIDKDELADPSLARQAPRPELKKRWHPRS